MLTSFLFKLRAIFVVVVVTTHGSCASVVSGKDTVKRQGMASPESYLEQAATS